MIRVLIVEDVDSMRELLRQLVAAIPGVQVSGTARNTLEARIELQRRRPDLVFLDEVLPGESSLDLLEELQALRLPVYLLTSTSLSDERPAPPPGTLGRLKKPGWKAFEQEQARFEAAIRQALPGSS